ncbi:hypothetical protein ANO11243_020400 [Dothideomycetidae sp. 11243]|nr:hypothetical protein ANO11243_020400 [fungal sp. No.11243]
MDQAEPTRPSRYRSVRSAATAAAQSAPAQDPKQELEPTTINRTRSRYHRNAASSAPNPPHVPAMSPEMPQSAGQDAPTSPPQGGVQRVRQASDAFAEHRREYLTASTPPVPQERVLTPHADAERRRRLNGNSASRKEHEDISRGRGQTTDRQSLQQSWSGNRYDSPMLGNTSTREKPFGSAAPQQILATTVNVKDEKSANCFGGLFKRKKEVMHQHAEKHIEHHSKENFIKQGGGGIVPGIDAPKSAVNSGERRVLIECNTSSLEFPVDLNTTAADLLQSAANCFSEHIDPKTFVLMEYFNKVGVQRPLRRYEHVRDVMNSWDDELQNYLIVMPAINSGADPALLQTSNVSRQKPSEQSFVLHYSQKVGKWDRRLLIIRQDGQVVAKKNPNTADKDAVNVCHLSDYDIYTPTIRQTSKKIRPPKKLCFAIKSQQKSSMFETTTDFVHFFCTAEKDIAIAFYTAVQGWRSWYLVNMMGEGLKKRRSVNATNGVPDRSLSTKQAKHARDMSMESHYQLGSFKPLVETDALNFAQMDLHDNNAVRRNPSHRDSRRNESVVKQVLSDNEPLGKLMEKRASVDGGHRNSGTFAQSGLLGRTYSQRQHEQTSREGVTSQPFTNGPSLLNDASLRNDDGLMRTASNRLSRGRPDQNTGDAPRHSVSRHRESLDIQRTNSNRAPHKPLIDLTPTYREPPQHQRKGRGFNVSSPQPGGLINAATSPDDPLNLPPSTDWRGSANADTTADLSHTRTRSRSQPRRTSVPQPARFQNSAAYSALTGGQEHVRPAPEAPSTARDPAFVPGGLLEQAAGGWGDSSRGRGVAMAGNAGKPLLDLSEPSQYVPGSLLERAERAQVGH